MSKQAQAEKKLIWLATRFPRAFTGPPQPLKLKILEDLFEVFYPGMRYGSAYGWTCGREGRAFASAFAIWCQSRPYLERCVAGAARIDLQGNPAGVVTAAEAAFAAERLKEDPLLRGMSRRTVSAEHPYFALASASVRSLRDGTWLVKWRDFYGIMQDNIFNTEAEARAFAEKICKPPITVYDDNDGNFASADQFWREMLVDKEAGR